MLQITQAKPNPLGKDRKTVFGIPKQQLAGEWFDIKNTGSVNVSMKGIKVQHVAYSDNGPCWSDAYIFQPVQVLTTLTLKPGEIWRIHSGGLLSITELLSVDRDGAHYHKFTGKNYILDNKRVDGIRVCTAVTEQVLDEVFYDENPIEGKILKRFGKKLI